jgi:putative transposase
MYDWQKLSAKERAQILAERLARGFPWHSPPHIDIGSEKYHITAACYHHQAFIGSSIVRMEQFSKSLLSHLYDAKAIVHAWCVLPNHYHVLVDVPSLADIVKVLGHLHGQTSFAWNGEEKCRGRKVWHRCGDRGIRSARHFWVTMNYIHNNPVRHLKFEKWRDWPFSSARDFIAREGIDNVLKIWREYPLLDYGKGWDDL